MVGDRGLTLIEMGPFGVIGAITPCTNPSETVLCNTIGMLAGGNTVVFNPHPAAIKTSIFAINLLNEASLEAGGPDNIACNGGKTNAGIQRYYDETQRHSVDRGNRRSGSCNRSPFFR